MRSVCLLAVAVILGRGPAVRADGPAAKVAAPAASKKELIAFQSRLSSATLKHLDRLIGPKGEVAALKGKSADGMTAFAYYLMYEKTGKAQYRTAALELADRVVKAMKATKHGVLYIKEKDTGAGESIPGGGPPAFGWYASQVAYIYHREGGREKDLKYIATALDNFPWNEKGWWAAAIDIKTGKPKVPLTKPSPINKNAAMAMAAGMVSSYVKKIDPALSARLKKRADQCIYKQIIPAQEADGFWHYGLTGNDPKNKDILGYFMVTTHALLQLQQLTDSYKDAAFQSALDKACAFALKRIAPMTDPNKGPRPPANRATQGTPAHYKLTDDPKRGFALGVVLFGGRNFGEGMKIIDCWMKKFPHGNAGQAGAHAVHPSALMLLLLQREVGKPS